jgi:hypothetical protein
MHCARLNVAGLNFLLAKAIFLGQPIQMASWRPFLAILLAVFVTAGLSLSAAHASNMSAKMDMMSGMGTASDSECPACPGGAGGSDKPMICTPACVAAAFALVPHDMPVLAAILVPRLPWAPELLLHGRDSLPDPYPPRSSDLV